MDSSSPSKRNGECRHTRGARQLPATVMDIFQSSGVWRPRMDLLGEGRSGRLSTLPTRRSVDLRGRPSCVPCRLQEKEKLLEAREAALRDRENNIGNLEANAVRSDPPHPHIRCPTSPARLASVGGRGHCPFTHHAQSWRVCPV